MHLHRCRGQQEQAVGALLETLHQLQQKIGRAFLRGARALAARMMRLVENDEIPRVGHFEQFVLAVAPAHQVLPWIERGELVALQLSRPFPASRSSVTSSPLPP